MATKNNPTQLSESPILPSSCYTSPEFYQREMESIFSRAWVCLGFTYVLEVHPQRTLMDGEGRRCQWR